MKKEIEIKCPKCSSTDNEPKLSNGGPAIYKQLVCKTCGFEGGTSRVYSGEGQRVEKEIKERFAIERKDAVEAFCNSIF